MYKGLGMENKEIEKAQDRKRKFDVCLLIMGLVFVFMGTLYVVLDNFLSKTAMFIYLMCWLVYSICFIVFWLVVGVNVNKKSKKIRENNYAFDRTKKPEQTKTTFESINNNEKVFFNRKKLRFSGLEFAYEELIFDYITFEENIMLHVYTKENDERPLLIFVVTEEFYHCAKFFKLQIEKLDSEINMFNLNFNK